jgi:adenosine/AMP kinase
MIDEGQEVMKEFKEDQMVRRPGNDMGIKNQVVEGAILWRAGIFFVCALCVASSPPAQIFS